MAMSNCPKCGKLFNRTRKRVCPACVEAEEAEFDKVVEYIRENGICIPSVVADGTDVALTKINEWVRDGKLDLISPNTAVKQGCRVCGRSVDGGEICEKCRKKLAAGIAAARAETSAPQQPSPVAAQARTFKDRMYSRDE